MDESAVDFDLDIIGVLEGTDKSSSVSSAWDYLRHYQALFAPWRDQPINFIEIGVGRGGSLNLWRQYFVRAQIVGIDINPDCRAFAGDRVAIEIGSQDDPVFLKRICESYPPSIIIDDGSHLAHHIVWSFKYLFPRLLDGGVYIVEDLAFHFGKGRAVVEGKGISATDYFLDLARQRMAMSTHLRELRDDDRYIRDHLDAITFIGSALAVHKGKPRNIAAALAFVDRHRQSISESPNQLLRIAEYILRHNGPLDHAERLVQDALRLSEPSPEANKMWVDILCRQARLDEAAAAAAETTRLWPDDHGAWYWLSLVEQRRDHVDGAIAALERAVSIHPSEVFYLERLSHLFQHQGEPDRALVAAEKAALLRPDFEPLQQRVADLERLVAATRAT